MSGTYCFIDDNNDSFLNQYSKKKRLLLFYFYFPIGCSVKKISSKQNMLLFNKKFIIQYFEFEVTLNERLDLQKKTDSQQEKYSVIWQMDWTWNNVCLLFENNISRWTKPEIWLCVCSHIPFHCSIGFFHTDRFRCESVGNCLTYL